jgi:hypothetical protein
MQNAHTQTSAKLAGVRLGNRSFLDSPAVDEQLENDNRRRMSQRTKAASVGPPTLSEYDVSTISKTLHTQSILRNGICRLNQDGRTPHSLQLQHHRLRQMSGPLGTMLHCCRKLRPPVKMIRLQAFSKRNRRSLSSRQNTGSPSHTFWYVLILGSFKSTLTAK